MQVTTRSQRSVTARRPRIFRALPVLVVIAFLGGTLGAVHASNHVLDTEYITNTIIKPAADNLRIATSKEPNLALWLDLLRLDTTVAVHTGPNAYATYQDGMPVVYIDMQFIQKIFDIADFAGLLMSSPSPAVMLEAGKRFGEAISSALANKEPLPSFKADLETLPLDPGRYVMSKDMSHLAFGAAMQFIILHEIAHHQLDHFDRDPVNNAESRQWELDADSWAIEKMQYLGFGLNPLAGAIQALVGEEQVLQQAGLLPPVDDWTHPTWQQRAANLDRFDIRKPASFGNWINIIEVSMEAATGRYYANELVIPRRPMPGVMAQFRQFGKLVQMPVEHRSDGSVHVYGRSPFELSEIVVTDLDSLYPQLFFRYTNLQSGQVSSSETRGYQADMAYLYSSPVKGFSHINVKDVVEMDPISVFQGFLLQVENNPQMVKRVTAIQSDMLSRFNGIMIDYAQGRISMQTAQQRSQQNAQLKANEMQQVLGTQKFSRMKQLMLSSSLTSDAYNKLLSQ